MTQDLTKITTPFGLLDKETQEALRAHGGPYEWLNWGGSWEETDPPHWSLCYAYRVKPQPPKPREWWIYWRESHGAWLVSNTEEYAVERHESDRSPIIHVREVLE